MLKDEIEKEYKNHYKNHYENRDDYKLAMLFCKMMPQIDVCEGFPKYLLVDNFELFYELATIDAFYENEEYRLSYIDFIETAIKNGIQKKLIFDVFEGLYKRNNKYSDLFKPLTKQYYNEFFTKRRLK